MQHFDKMTRIKIDIQLENLPGGLPIEKVYVNF